jgi:hypothetical protein
MTKVTLQTRLISCKSHKPKANCVCLNRWYRLAAGGAATPSPEPLAAWLVQEAASLRRPLSNLVSRLSVRA